MSDGSWMIEVHNLAGDGCTTFILIVLCTPLCGMTTKWTYSGSSNCSRVHNGGAAAVADAIGEEVVYNRWTGLH